MKISCQGSGQELLFKNMENGEKLSGNIDELISRTKTLIREDKKESTSGMGSMSMEKPTAQKIEPDRTYQDEFKMEPLRTWMPAIILSPLLVIIFPAGIAVAISNMIAIACNTFRIKPDTVEHTFDFLSKHTREFSLDKVTAVVFKESFVDKWCRTCSILFWSIGSGVNIAFSNIKNTSELREKVLAKKGIRPQNVLHTLQSEYDPVNMIKGNLYVAVVLAFLILPWLVFLPPLGWTLLGIALIGCTIGFIYRVVYYKNSRIVFYEGYAHFTRGLFFKEDYFAFYDDIKDISTTRFPLSNKGNVRFNVAGEVVYKTRNGEHVVSNAFTIRFVDDINELDELIDTVFYQRPSAEKIGEIKQKVKNTSSKPQYSTKPCLSNYLLFVIPGVVIIDAITLFTVNMVALGLPQLLIYASSFISISIIACVIAAIKAISYNIQPYRVYERSGVIFKKQTSITFNKMDFINLSQGPVNKMFANGNITINTTGSRKPELVIKNIRDYKKFYEIVKNEYK